MSEFNKPNLLPCPFCGGRAQHLRTPDNEDDPNSGGEFIECRNPMCQASTAVMFPLMDSVTAQLAERWNRRHSDGRVVSAGSVDVLAAMDHAIAVIESEYGSASDMDDARATVAKLFAERDRLDALINNPQTALFLEAVRAEAAHQVERWGTVHDRAKEPQDWYWLLAYLGGKALRSHIDGDEFKALHHTISSAAVLANWFAAIKLGKSEMAPGSSDLQQFLDEQFGPEALAKVHA